MSSPRTVTHPASEANSWQNDFISMLPRIERQLRCEFRDLDDEAAEEALQEGIASCLQAFVRLHRSNRCADAHPSVLARYAAYHVRAGRKVAGSANVNEPLSRYAQLKRRICRVSFNSLLDQAGKAIEEAVTDRHASVPDRVALRIDVPRWLRGLSSRRQRIAKDLAMGCTTGEVATRYGLTAGRISQIRRELYLSWETFHRDAALAS